MKSKAQRQAAKQLKGRGIRPGKVTKTNKWGQATGGYSPFAPSAGQMDVADDVEYEAYDRVNKGGHWFTHRPKG